MNVRKHLSDNRKLYSGVLIGVGVAGFTWVIVRTQCQLPRGRPLAELPRSTKELPGSSFHNISGTVIAHNTGPVMFGGYAKKLVRNATTGEIFGSVHEAAEQAGVTFSKMSRHINGHMDNVNGDTYHIIGVSTAA